MPEQYRYPVACLLLLVSLLTGCSQPEGQALLEDYLYRLGNATDTQINSNLNPLPPIPAYPPRRERLVALQDMREGMLDTLNLRACNLLPLIAQRNSSLGRVMLVSQQLIYEIRFYSLIRQCRHLPLVRNDSELLAQVNAIYQAKQQNLPRVLWNAIYNAEEIEANFALGATPLPPGETGSLGPSLTSLQHFEQLIRLSQQTAPWQLPAFVEQLENDYEVLHRNQFGAHWLSSIRLVTETLSRAADSLETRLSQRPLCPQARPTPQAKILHNVFTRYYVARVQPYMAQTHRSGQRWLKQHEVLLGALQYGELLADYREQVLSLEGQLWQNYLRARDRHTRAWQQQLRQCAMMPGGTNNKGPAVS